MAVLAYSLNHWETKDFFFNASKVAPTLLGLDGKVISAKGRKFRVRTGRYVPIEGECLPSECPNFHLMAFELYENGIKPDGGTIEVKFQRHQTGTKALALAIALAKRVDPHEGMPTLAEILEKENKRLAKIRKKNQEKYARFIGGGKSVVKNAAPKGRRSRRKAVRRKKTAE
ncbi:MAG: hypothetical protein J7K48_04655 [Thermococcus sp.]|nr:hypothetical protein [Thermococcus sp.]